VLIAADLLVADGERRVDAIDRAPLIHAADTLAAGLAALSGRMPGSSGLLITLISSINTGLALYARRGLTRRRRAS
jgi:hypothetical protein